MPDKKQHKVEAVERALAILEAFGDGRARMPLSELVARTGLYGSTILRLAASLERFGYLQRDADGAFRLGPSLWRLGVLYQNAFNLADHVRPVLNDLVRETGETAAFYIREGNQRICLYRVNGPRLIRSHLEEGSSLPLDRGASARILVAFTDGTGPFYEAIRRDRHYTSQGERDPETAAVSVPVLGHRDALIGALGLTGPRGRFTPEKCAELIDVLKRASLPLSRALGG